MQLNLFDLLTDENIDPILIDYLREKGFDVLDVKEQGWAGRKDEDLLFIANEQRRVVVTHDSDFGTLVFRQGVAFTGILYLRPGHFEATPHVQSINAVLEQNFDVDVPFILIAENVGTTVRIRLRRFS